MNQQSPIQHYLNPNFFYIERQTHVEAVRYLFRNFPKLQVLPVVENGKFLGVIFRNEFLKNYLLHEDSGLQITSIINKDIVHLRPSDPAIAAREILDLGVFPTLPIVDKDNRLKGVIKPNDLCSKAAQNLPSFNSIQAY